MPLSDSEEEPESGPEAESAAELESEESLESVAELESEESLGPEEGWSLLPGPCDQVVTVRHAAIRSYPLLS